jgi:hypothetical protein
MLWFCFFVLMIFSIKYCCLLFFILSSYKFLGLLLPFYVFLFVYPFMSINWSWFPSKFYCNWNSFCLYLNYEIWSLCWEVFKFLKLNLWLVVVIHEVWLVFIYFGVKLWTQILCHFLDLILKTLTYSPPLWNNFVGSDALSWIIQFPSKLMLFVRCFGGSLN